MNGTYTRRRLKRRIDNVELIGPALGIGMSLTFAVCLWLIWGRR